MAVNLTCFVGEPPSSVAECSLENDPWADLQVISHNLFLLGVEAAGLDVNPKA